MRRWTTEQQEAAAELRAAGIPLRPKPTTKRVPITTLEMIQRRLEQLGAEDNGTCPAMQALGELLGTRAALKSGKGKCGRCNGVGVVFDDVTSNLARDSRVPCPDCKTRQGQGGVDALRTSL